jgi:hypothetical protein
MTENEEFWKNFLEEINEIEEKFKKSNKEGMKEAIEACERIKDLLK